MELEISVYYHSDETLELKNIDVPYSVLECDTRKVTFYNIPCIAEWQDEQSGEILCEIFIGDTTFITVKSYEEIKKIIHDAKGNKR